MPSPEEMQMMEKWTATTQPGEHHKKLAPFVGSWNTVTKVWMGGPGTPPTETQGTTEVKWVLGGRYIAEDFNGQMIMPDETGDMKPVPWQGRGLTGYDIYQNMYVGSWADSVSTHLLSFRGGCDPSGKTFTFYFLMDEPMLDIRGRMVKMVSRIINNDKHVLEMFDLHARDDYKVFEIIYTRK